MMIARAAKEDSPCPSDSAIARAYGTHSLGRARRVLTISRNRVSLFARLTVLVGGS